MSHQPRRVGGSPDPDFGETNRPRPLPTVMPLRMLPSGDGSTPLYLVPAVEPAPSAVTAMAEMAPRTHRHRFRIKLGCPKGIQIQPGEQMVLFIEVDSIVCGEDSWDACPINDGNPGRSTVSLGSGLVLSLLPAC